MKIVDVKAYPTSFKVPKERQVSLGIGTMTKRDCVWLR
jgi:D-galactarolactone cycloisomerase